LVSDESQHVRASLASDVMGLAPLIGKQYATDYLLDVFLQLLKDENAEVRLNIISKLEPVPFIKIQFTTL
jgi:serine/threonine-protein phosphatase 2A regulatory subunit A